MDMVSLTCLWASKQKCGAVITYLSLEYKGAELAGWLEREQGGGRGLGQEERDRQTDRCDPP